MDLTKAEKTLSKLEENGEKIAEVTKSVQKFEEVSKKLQNLPDDIKKNTSSIELRIVDVEKQISKENEKLTTLIRDELKSSIETTNKNLSKIETQFNKQNEDLKTEIDKVSQDLKEFIKSNDLENLKINRNIYLLMFFVIMLIGMSVYQSRLF
tara:strand:+ start:505 stop:963 length:459 start_codon:yes stop_codon:yes gene_type:complete